MVFLLEEEEVHLPQPLLNIAVWNSCGLMQTDAPVSKVSSQNVFLYPRTAAESSCALSSNSTGGVTEEKRERGGNVTFRHSGTATLQNCKGQTECAHAASDQASPHRKTQMHTNTHMLTCASNGAPLNASTHAHTRTLKHTHKLLRRIKTKEKQRF